MFELLCRVVIVRFLISARLIPTCDKKSYQFDSRIFLLNSVNITRRCWFIAFLVDVYVAGIGKIGRPCSFVFSPARSVSSWLKPLLMCRVVGERGGGGEPGKEKGTVCSMA